jgi:ribose transport system ATP-binding protein
MEEQTARAALRATPGTHRFQRAVTAGGAPEKKRESLSTPARWKGCVPGLSFEFMSGTILQFDKIEKRFFGVRVLGGVSFALEEGNILGLVGENGAGKSTLMNILGGVIPFDAGRMLLGEEEYLPRNPAEARARGLAFIHQELNLFTNLSVAENIFITDFPKRRIAGVPLINRREMKARTRSLLESLDLNVAPEALVENLSPGERQLVEIAKAMSVEAKIIILDEPTTSLTVRETERLFALLERLRARGVSMIYISHNLGDALRMCDDIVVLRDGAVVGAGRKSEFTEERMIALMVGRTLDQLFPERACEVSPEVALEVKGLTQPGALEDISFRLRKGEVLGVAGLMGAGRTELARALFGLDPTERGEVFVNGKPAAPTPRGRIQNGMAFLTEDRRAEGLMMEAGVAENIALASLPSFARPGTGLLNQVEMASAINRVAQSVRIRGAADMLIAVKTLSGGNQQKVVLARWLLDEPSVFILDEPTRGVDVGAKSEIYRIINDLAESGAGVLMISSEIEELIGLCDRILVMAAGRITDCVERAKFDRERILRAALGNKEEA